jgi:opacity protein-like surface antigen
MLKLSYLMTPALLALATTLAVHAGTEMKDSKDVKQMSQTATECDAGFYVAAYGGVNFSTDYGDRHASLAGPAGFAATTPDNIHSEVGGVGGIKAGYNFQSFAVCDGLRLQPAVEAEGLYIGMGSKYTSVVPGYNDQTSWNNAAGFVNGIVRFKLTDSGSFFSRLTPYLGIGVGAEYLTAHTDLNFAGGAHPGDVGDSDVDFAAQALGGLDYAITPHISLFTEYKFIDALGASFNSNIGGGNTYRFAPSQIQQNLATVGVKYTF